jgi:2-polyprenyl-3-methyl-5-hydroxy-6-metoxy-1,4-benzoquinol methylase
MSQNFSYQDYVSDNKFLSDYNFYQTKYAKQMRESDKVIIKLIQEAVAALKPVNRRLRLLDVGCSTGNLLLHVKRIFTDMELTGCDLALSSLEKCRANPELSGIEFKVLNLLKMAWTKRLNELKLRIWRSSSWQFSKVWHYTTSNSR